MSNPGKLGFMASDPPPPHPTPNKQIDNCFKWVVLYRTHSDHLEVTQPGLNPGYNKLLEPFFTKKNDKEKN